MKIFHIKKATEIISNWPYWMFYAVAVGLVALVIVKMANINVAEASRIPDDLEDELVLIPKFYNSEDCFVYKDDVGRVNTKVIDSKKFTQENLDKCFPSSNIKYAFSLSLEQKLVGEGPIWRFGTELVNTFNWRGGFPTKEIIEDVFVMHGDIKYNGILRIGIQDVQ